MQRFGLDTRKARSPTALAAGIGRERAPAPGLVYENIGAVPDTGHIAEAARRKLGLAAPE